MCHCVNYVHSACYRPIIGCHGNLQICDGNNKSGSPNNLEGMISPPSDRVQWLSGDTVITRPVARCCRHVLVRRGQVIPSSHGITSYGDNDLHVPHTLPHGYQ
jgi:hypothetical protein